MEQSGVQLIAQGANVYIGDMKSATSATNTFVDATDKGSHRVSAAGQAMIGALRQVGTIVVDAFGKALRATADFVGDSIGLAGDFEAGMLNFQSVAGKDVDTSGLEEFRDLFLDIGKRLPVSTAEVQQAAIEMVKGGIDPATIAAGGLEQNIQFAAAAMSGDLVKAAEISSKIMGGWAGVNATAAEKADFLTHATDLLTKAANASATDVEGLSRGIFQAQGIAKSAGVEFDDLVTTLAELAPRFGSSAEAGTSLKNLIARLQPTTKNATAAMIDLGLMTEEGKNKFFDATGSFVGFQQASELLKGSVEGLTDKQKALELQMIFGNDAMSAASALAELGAAGYTNMADALENANGVQAAAALKQQGYNTALDNAKGSVEALQIQLGSYLLPILTDLLNNVIAPGINAFSDWAGAILSADNPMQSLITSIDEIAPGFQSFVTGVETGIGILMVLGDEVAALIGWFNQASTESGELGGAVDDLSGIWTKAGAVVDDVMIGYQAITLSVLPVVTKFWDDHGTEISAFVKTTYDSIIRIVNAALDLYDAIVPPILQSVAGFIDEHGEAIQTILSGAWDVISGTITGVLALIEGAIKITLDVIHGDWSQAWTDLQNMSVTFTESLGKVISGFLDIIAGFFDTSLAEIVQLWENNWAMLVEIATETDWAQVGQDVVDGILSGLQSSWDSLTSWITDKVSGLVDAALDAIDAGSPAKKFMPVGEFAVTGIMQGFIDTWPQLTTLIGKISDDLIGQMEDIGREMQNTIADSFGATASIDRQIAKNLDSFKDILPEYQAYTTGALKEAQSQAEAFLDPAEGAKFFQMRSKQILEYAKLQKELSEAETADDRQRIEQQMALINKAQTAEISGFNAQQMAQQSPMGQMADSINDIMKALADPKLKLTDEQIAWIGQLSSIWGQLQAPVQTRADSYAHPPMMQYPASGPSTSTSTQNISMPIYTNQSPAVLQQSWAVLQASMT